MKPNRFPAGAMLLAIVLAVVDVKNTSPSVQERGVFTLLLLCAAVYAVVRLAVYGYRSGRGK